MQIPLNLFEQLISEEILSRGLTYFKKGKVKDFTNESLGTYTAVVSGTYDYDVSLEIKNEVIVKHQCNCPYDYGAICKHVVAVIFRLLDDTLQVASVKVLKPKTPKKARVKSVNVQIKEMLRSISHEDLVNFVQEISKRDKKVQVLFMTRFSSSNEHYSKASYHQQIKSILKAAQGHDGWVNRTGIKFIHSSLQPLLDNCKNLLLDGNYEHAFVLSTAFLEEMVLALDYEDDSYGDIGYYADWSYEILSELVTKEISESLRAAIYTYCIDAFNKKIFKGWDWHTYMLTLATQIAENQKEADIILNCCTTLKGKYNMETTQTIELELIKRFKSTEEYEQFINVNISNFNIRLHEIDNAFNQRNFTRVKQLCDDGVETDKHDKPGLVVLWHSWLLTVAKVEKDKDAIIDYASLLFLNDNGNKQEYYDLLKKTMKPDKWKDYSEKMIALLLEQKWVRTDLLEFIFINEKMWDRLLQMLESSRSLEHLSQYLKLFPAAFMPRFIDSYCNALKTYLEFNVSRSHYKTACRHLRQINKLGATDQVAALITEFRKLYPMRKALMEELNQV